MQNSANLCAPLKSTIHASKGGQLLGYVLRQEKPQPYTMQTWKPDDSEIKFLNSRIMGQAKFETISFGKCQLFRATFFSHIKQFETVVEASLWKDRQELEEDIQNNFRWLKTKGRPVAGVFGLKKCEQGEKSLSLDDAVKTVSQLIRNTNALKASDGKSISGSIVFADRGGIGFVDPINSTTAQFERYLICLMLMIAIESILVRTSNNLSKLVSTPSSVEDSDKLLAEYKEFLRFASSAFAQFPVRRSSVAVYEVWEMLKEHYRLSDVYSEVERQLSTISKFLQSEETRKLLFTQNQLLISERDRSRLEAEERRKAEGEREKADQARLSEEVFQQRSSRRQARLGMVVTFIGLLIALISIPDPIRLKLCEKIPATEGLLKSTIELVCAE